MSQAPHLDKLLDIVYGVYRSSIESLAKKSEVAGWVYEVNRIFLVSYLRPPCPSVLTGIGCVPSRCSVQGGPQKHL
jgi:hypothetical protein